MLVARVGGGLAYSDEMVPGVALTVMGCGAGRVWVYLWSLWARWGRAGGGLTGPSPDGSITW